MVRLTLEHAGHTVSVAENGTEGLELFRKDTNFDLVLLDQRMPGLSGTEVQAEIYKIKPDQRIILATAHGTIDLALETIQAGASDFLKKPFSADTLRQAVTKALDRPVSRRSAVPIGDICREFTRTNINGYSFEFVPQPHHEQEDDLEFTFRVQTPNGEEKDIVVIIPAYTIELVYARADIESVPGGESFWRSLAEEHLADHLWRYSALPDQKSITITDLTDANLHWIDQMLTVTLSNDHA